MPFQALKMKWLDSMTFQVFHDPYETLQIFYFICRSPGRRRRRCLSSQRRTHVATTEKDQFGLVTNLSHTKL